MADTKFTASYEGIGDMLNAPWMIAAMMDRAHKVKEYAETTAPVYEGDWPDPHRGRFKASFRVQGFAHGGVHRDRAEGRVTNDAEEAIFAEFGGNWYNPRLKEWVFQEGHHTLRNALYEALWRL